MGALAAPLVGVLLGSNAWPLVVVMLAAAGLAVLSFALAPRSEARHLP
jgi:hypothetical protein